MPINNITQTISTLPPAGARGVDVQTLFVTKQEDFQDHLQGTTVTELNTLKTQFNARIGEINSTATTMNGYATSASSSASTAITKAGEASTSASGALTSRNQAETFKNNASASATKASQWADNNYNVEVETGKYSAKHWSVVAENVVLNTVKLTGNYTGVELGNYHQLKYLPGIPSGDPGFDNGNKYFLLCPWDGVENKIVGKLYAGRQTSVASHGRNWVIDITSKYSTIRMSNYSIQSTTDRDTFNLVKVTYNGIEYLGIKLTDPNTPIFRAGIVFSGFESGCIFEWANVQSITNEEAAPTYGYNKFSNDIKAPNMLSGTYLPVITNRVGISSSSAYVAHYMRCGDEVTVAGGFSITTNVINTEVIFDCSLPIPSILSSGRECVGSFGSSGNATYSNCTITSNTTTNSASFRCIPSVSGSITVYFTFQYIIK